MDREGVEVWLKEYGIKNYTINEDLSVDVNGVVNLVSVGLVELPIRFGIVSGSFYCTDNPKLSVLLGCPIKVGGNFYCNDNKLTNLVGCPSEVGGNFYCYNNELTSLNGCPIGVIGGFNCNNNKLSNLLGCPIVIGLELLVRYVILDNIAID